MWQLLSEKFVQAINKVLRFNPTSKPSQVKVLIPEEMYKAEEKWVLTLFKQAWNSAVDGPRIEGECTMTEWVCVIPYLVVACRKAVHTAVRAQFDGEQDVLLRYVPDENDMAKPYYCVGVVCRPLLKFFSGKSRITNAIQALFITEKQAVDQCLPTHEVDSKIFSTLLYAGEPAFAQFRIVRDTYHAVTHRKGYACVQDPDP